MKTYIIRVIDINGRAISTEDDDEDAAREWLWRTLVRMTRDGQNPTREGYRPQIELIKFTES